MATDFFDIIFAFVAGYRTLTTGGWHPSGMIQPAGLISLVKHRCHAEPKRIRACLEYMCRIWIAYSLCLRHGYYATGSACDAEISGKHAQMVACLTEIKKKQHHQTCRSDTNIGAVRS